MNPDHVWDTETVTTDAGDYVVRFFALEQARDRIAYDVEQRQKNASLVGAGFVGII